MFTHFVCVFVHVRISELSGVILPTHTFYLFDDACV